MAVKKSVSRHLPIPACEDTTIYRHYMPYIYESGMPANYRHTAHIVFPNSCLIRPDRR